MRLLNLANSMRYFGILIFSNLIIIGCVSRSGIEHSKSTPTCSSITTIPSQTIVSTVETATVPATLMLPSTTPTTKPFLTETSTVTIAGTVEPTITSLQTLSVEEESLLLSALMASNDDCNLLCWWNVVPGETSEEEAKEIFVSKGIVDWVVSFDETYSIIGLGYGTPDGAAHTRDVIVRFGLENDLVQYISIDGGYRREDLRSIFVRDWQSYSPVGILNQHGMPIYVEFIEVGNSPYYRLILSYPTLGIEVNYSIPFEPIENGQERICFNLENIDFIGLILYPPERASNLPFSIIPNRLASYTSWESTTGLSLETFQELFNDVKNAPCIELE